MHSLKPKGQATRPLPNKLGVPLSFDFIQGRAKTGQMRWPERPAR